MRLTRRRLASIYRRAYERERPLDEGRLRYWVALQALEAAAQVEQLHAGDLAGSTRADSASRVPNALSGSLLALYERQVARLD